MSRVLDIMSLRRLGNNIVVRELLRSTGLELSQKVLLLKISVELVAEAMKWMKKELGE